MEKNTKNQGFTLIEALISLLIIAFLSTVAVPSFTRYLAAHRLRAASFSLASALVLGRSAAVKIQGRAVLCKSADHQLCTTSDAWDQGWILFHDHNNDAQRDPGTEPLVLAEPGHESITIEGNFPVKNYVSYTHTGQARYPGGAFQAGTITLCNSYRQGRSLVLSATGRVRSAEITCP